MAARADEIEPMQVRLRLPFSAGAVAQARRDLTLWMTAAGYSAEAVDDARLVVSELVANAIRHARPLADGQLLASWRYTHHGVEISVTDGGAQTRPITLEAAPAAQAGRGLAMVDTVSARWWTDWSPTRATVHVLLTAQ